MTVLRSCLSGQVISRFGDIEWSARLTNLSKLDFLLWRYLKGRVYRENPKTLDQLQEVIQTEIRLIRPEMISAVMKTMRKRADSFIVSKGHHLKNIICKK